MGVMPQMHFAKPTARPCTHLSGKRGLAQGGDRLQRLRASARRARSARILAQGPKRVVLVVQGTKAPGLPHEERPPGHLLWFEGEAFGRVELASGERPAGPRMPGQLIPQVQPQQPHGHRWHRHCAGGPVVNRAWRDVQYLRSVGRCEAQTSEKPFEAPALIRAALAGARRALLGFGGCAIDIPQCILC